MRSEERDLHSDGKFACNSFQDWLPGHPHSALQLVQAPPDGSKTFYPDKKNIDKLLKLRHITNDFHEKIIWIILGIKPMFPKVCSGDNWWSAW